jgi:hypothetical protein
MRLIASFSLTDILLLASSRKTPVGTSAMFTVTDPKD